MSQRPQVEHLIETLAAIVRTQAIEILEVDEDRAALLADEVVTQFCDSFGGEMQYLPKGRVYRTSKLHRMIWNAYNYKNVRELREQFGVSLQYIYRIVKREQARENAERQATIPGLESKP